MDQAVARAKVNLFLHIVGRRNDGLHALESLVMFADFGDLITVSPARRFQISIDGAFASSVPGDGGIIRQAAHALNVDGREIPRCDIGLTKNIPVGGGLGGGSSDGSVAAKLMNKLSEFPLDQAALLAALSPLGADIPICLHGGNALVSGAGELVEALPDLPSLHAVLINPGIELATKDVFAQFAKTDLGDAVSGQYSELSEVHSAAELITLIQGHSNDLQASAIQLLPSIGHVIALLQAEPKCLVARMSGSGATCFGLFESEEAARATLDAISLRKPSWWGISTQLGSVRN